MRPSSIRVPTDGAVLVRLPAKDRTWVADLPAVPGGRTLTVTIGHPDLLPVPPDDLVSAGYRIVGVAAEHRPLGRIVDVLVPAALRSSEPEWWERLAGCSQRIFDLRHGPVLRLLEPELTLHLRVEG